MAQKRPFSYLRHSVDWIEAVLLVTPCHTHTRTHAHTRTRTHTHTHRVHGCTNVILYIAAESGRFVHPTALQKPEQASRATQV